MSSIAPITVAELLQLTEQLLNLDEGSLAIETLLVDVPGWDSMGVLLLMAEMDERFSITLNEVALAKLKGVKDIIAVVKDAGLLSE
ncbi:MAG: acyl carrier protein [Pseudomonadota bacterium]